MFPKLIVVLFALAMQNLGFNLSGQIVFDASSVKPPANLALIHVVLARPEDSSVLAKMKFGLLPPTALPGGGVGADGKFSVQGLKPGTYFVHTQLLPASWRLRSAVYDGKDVAEAGLQVPIRGLSGTGDLVLTFTDRSTAISGTVRPAGGTSTSTITVVAFPQNRLMWGLPAPRTKTSRLGADSSYMLRDLPPGRYFIAAVTDYTPELQNTPEYWDRVSTTAVSVVLGDGGQQVVDLKAGGYQVPGPENQVLASPACVFPCVLHGGGPQWEPN